MQSESHTRRWDEPPPLPRTHYLDNRIYSDPAVFAAEQETIFAGGWKFVCHESELPTAGDYKVLKVAGKSIVTVRGEDRAIRSFFNTCAHRGAELVRDLRGNLSKGFLCFYHLWTYDLRGRNTFMTRPEGYVPCGLRNEDVGLREVRTESILGLVFVSLKDDVEPLRVYLGGILDHLVEQLGPAELEIFHHHSCNLNANWKLWNDNNTEVYHEFLHVLNRTTSILQPGYHDRKWHLYPHGHATCGQAITRYEAIGLDERADYLVPGMQPSGIIAFGIFPDVMILVRGTVVRIDSMTPLGPGCTLLEGRGLGVKGDAPDIRAMRVEHHNQVWGPAGRNLAEDIAAVESQQRNISHGASCYSIIAREEDRRPQDDCNLRAYYQEWGRRVGRWPHNIDEKRDAPAPASSSTLRTANA